jgi:hypothetical protein
MTLSPVPLSRLAALPSWLLALLSTMRVSPTTPESRLPPDRSTEASLGWLEFPAPQPKRVSAIASVVADAD